MDDVVFTALRGHMVREIAAHAAQVAEHIGKEALDDRVMAVMAKVPRHEFVPAELRQFAYLNRPLPIGYDKTISQPFINALMTDLLDLRADDRVLEIGTGLGYHAAILAELADMVYSVELIEELATEARKRIGGLGYRNVEVRVANGYYGWPEHGPFDKIIVCAAPELVPPPLIGQLKPGGRIVIPAGLADAQKLLVVEKSLEGRTRITEILSVQFSALDMPH